MQNTAAHPILPLDPPPYAAREHFPYACARRWSAIPSGYDAAGKRLAVAVSDAARGELVAAVYRFFQLPVTIDPHIAAADAIESVFALHFPESAGGGRKWLRRSLFPAHSTVAPPDTSATGDVVRASRAPAPHGGSPPSDDSRVCRALINALGLLAGIELKDDPPALQSARTRVRYCQLLCGRLNLAGTTADALLAAAWMGGLPDWATMAARLDLPYPIAAILAPPPQADPGLPAQVFAVVAAYENLIRRDPAAARDTHMLRRLLASQTGAGADSDRILEALLQVLMDEQFLTQSQGRAGSILLVEPEESRAAGMIALLTADGYHVVRTTGAAEAGGLLRQQTPDAILIACDLPDGSGFAFCRECTGQSHTATVPVFMLTRGINDRLAAEALRNGAQDAVQTPVNAEFFLIKLRRATLGRSSSASSAAGVKGNLSDIRFSDLIQILAAGGKKVEITIGNGSDTGRICLDANAVVHAEQGSLSGAEAFYAIMGWPAGEFRAVVQEELAAPTMNTPVMSLLMEGSRRCDEGA
jgi:CheY-like chemotaxis protein